MTCNLSKYLKKLSIVEMKHAEKLIEHILFLEGTPNMTGPTQIKIGKTVKEQLENDLQSFQIPEEAVDCGNEACGKTDRAYTLPGRDSEYDRAHANQDREDGERTVGE